MPGICSVQETKENFMSSGRLGCEVGDCHTTQQFQGAVVSPAVKWTRCCWEDGDENQHHLVWEGFLEEMMPE